MTAGAAAGWGAAGEATQGGAGGGAPRRGSDGRGQWCERRRSRHSIGREAWHVPIDGFALPTVNFKSADPQWPTDSRKHIIRRLLQMGAFPTGITEADWQSIPIAVVLLDVLSANAATVSRFGGLIRWRICSRTAGR